MNSLSLGSITASHGIGRQEKLWLAFHGIGGGREANWGAPDEVLQGLVDGAVGDDLVDAVPGTAQREAQVVRHAQQLPKVHPCNRARISSETS